MNKHLKNKYEENMDNGCVITYFYIISFIITEVELQHDNNQVLSEIALLPMDRNVNRSQLRKFWLYYIADTKIIIM